MSELVSAVREAIEAELKNQAWTLSSSSGDSLVVDGDVYLNDLAEAAVKAMIEVIGPPF